MERYYGFDLGDAESAVARLSKENALKDPDVIPVCDAQSFITAFARRVQGELLIGESACYAPDVAERKLRFKSRFLTDPQSAGDVRTFAAGVLSCLIRDGNLVQGEDSCFYVGCPAGWSKADRERYRRIFEDAGYPPVRIISESRAALISACRSKHLQVAYDILSKPVLVVDIGSSTTDFAFIESGREVELQTAGEVMLGGGIMDRMLLEESVKASSDRAVIESIFARSEAWKNYCEFAARRLKEKYFSDENYWVSRSCSRSIEILYEGSHSLTLRMNKAIADRILNAPAPGLNGASFKQAFCESFAEVRSKIRDGSPELIFLTGGVSRLPAIGQWCQEAFPDSVVITTPQPEFSVARGLAWCGRIDEDMRAFRKEVNDLIETSTVESIVKAFMDVCEGAGYYCLLYSYESFLTAKMSAAFRSKYDVWCANITRTPSIAYGIHQYSFTGRVNGISGNVDLNRTSRDYPSIIKNAGKNGFKPAGNVLDTDGFRNGDKSLGVYFLKRWLIARGFKLDDNDAFGDGTEKAVNSILGAAGHARNGIAGEGFAKRFIK